jgi:NarL family two-component system response regulator LiaR
MKTNNFPIKVLLVDDHAIVRDGVRSYLETQEGIEVVGEADSGSKGVELAEKLQPDVVLMDLVMESPAGIIENMDGIEATYRVRKVSPKSEVIILTSFHEDTHIFPAIKAGALSYLLKTIEPEKLVAAIFSAAKGQAIIDSRVATRIMKEMRGENFDAPNPYEVLTDREQEVLQLIAKGFSNATIAEKLFITERTVKSHVSAILSKLNLNDRTQAAVFAWREGIVQDK